MTAVVSGPMVALQADLVPGAIAYVDADWLPLESSSAVPALVAEPDGWMRWNGDRARPPRDADLDAAAAGQLARIARDAAIAVADRPEGPVEVTGKGVVAATVRELLGLPASPAPVARPSAIVDATGHPAIIAAATERLADAGLLVLAGESREQPVALNLYPDVHGRGLRVIGVGPPLSAPGDPEGLGLPPTVVAPGTPLTLVLAERQGWYKIVGPPRDHI